MKKVFKILFKILGIGALIYGTLFAVFFLDLDGKALFYGVEPFLCKHYDKMERKDPMQAAYDTKTPKYEYK